MALVGFGCQHTSSIPLASSHHCHPTSALQKFRDFLLRGNVVDLAVAIVIGARVWLWLEVETCTAAARAFPPPPAFPS